MLKKKVLSTRFYAKHCSHFIRKWFQPNSCGEMWELGINAINSNFENLERALYNRKWMSMSLSAGVNKFAVTQKYSAFWKGETFAYTLHAHKYFEHILKGIVSDFNNIFLWHKSDDIHKINVISKISVYSNLTFTSYAWLICALTLLHISP